MDTYLMASDASCDCQWSHAHLNHPMPDVEDVSRWSSLQQHLVGGLDDGLMDGAGSDCVSSTVT